MPTPTIKENLSVPNSWKDTFIRAIKTSIAVLITGLPVNSLASMDISTSKVAILAAASAGGSVILNAILKWTSS